MQTIFGRVKQNKIIMVILALAVLIIIYSGIAMAQGTVTSKITTSSVATTYGEEVTFTVTAFDSAIGGTTPSGTVTFKDGNQDLATAELVTAEPVITTRASCSYECPTIQWGAYTFRANSFGDNRIALNIVTYDASGNIIQQLEKAGARYLSRITMDAAARTFTFWGQDDMTITVGWGELLSASSSASFKTSELAVGPHSITAAFAGDGNHAASEASVMYTVYPKYTVIYNGNGSTGGDVPANSGSYKGTKVLVSGNNGNLVKRGYTFAGWNTQANGQGTFYAAGAEGTISSDVTLYAYWTKVLDVGTGTASDPYQIATAEELDTVRNYMGSGLYFKLMADIDLSSYSQNWLPIGKSIAQFQGHVEGNGHKITGLMINRPDESYVGLFGYISYESSVTNIVLENVNVTGKQYVGGLTGRNDNGDISNSYVTGSVTGKSTNVGGLVGYIYYGTVSNSFAAANVTGAGNNVGGLTGNNTGEISNSYATGNVTGTGNNVGGLTGSNSGTISTSYATGSVTGSGTKVGGLIGSNNGTINYSFYDLNTTGQSDTGKGIGQATTQMKMQSTYADPSWDFANTWGISPSRNNGYPYLQALQKHVTYDGNGNTGGSAPVDSGSYEQGATVPVSGNNGNLVKTGYTFGGWNTAADGSGTSYAEGVVFRIGTQNVTLYAQWLSANTSLSGLTLDQGTLQFSPSQTKYAVDVVNSVSNLNLSLSKGDPTQTIKVTGATYSSVTNNVYAYKASSLVVGPNPIHITVTAQDGSSTVYRITITRKDIMGEPVQLSPEARMLTFPGGLAIRLPDGLVIPDGAALTVQDSNASPSGEVKLARSGQVIDFQFRGITITQPVQITLGYDEGANRSKLAIYYFNVATGKWEYNPSQVTNNGIQTTVSHFSTYGVFADTTAPDQVTITSGAKTTNSITLHLAANDDSGVANYKIYRDGTLIVETAESTYVDTGLSASKTYTYTAKAVDMLGNISNVSDSLTVATNGDGGSYTPAPPTNDTKITSTDGHLTLPAGKAGEVSQGDEIKIVIPANAAGKELKVTINKVSDIQTLITSKDVLLSPVFEVLKNFAENFEKPVTLSFKFDLNSLKGNEKPVIVYYDEVKKEWVKVGGTVSGNNISVDVNHFAKYAVFAVGDAVSPVTFSDIAAHWAEANIKQAVSAGIVSGYPDGTFKPGRTVTRAEFAVMLMNALKLQVDGAALTFTDKVKIGSWAQKSVAQAVYAGVINGYEDGSFRPNAEITRAEMTVMIAKALNLTGGAASSSGFADDKDIPDWARGAVAALKKLGMIEGKSANQFAPGDKTTRAEAVTVLLKMQEQ